MLTAKHHTASAGGTRVRDRSLCRVYPVRCSEASGRVVRTRARAYSTSTNNKNNQNSNSNPAQSHTFDVIVIGAGISGLATASRLQAQNNSNSTSNKHPKGITTCVLEAHTTLGGCAGYFERTAFLTSDSNSNNSVNNSKTVSNSSDTALRTFSFDVGATTFVDFDSPDGVGGELLRAVGLPVPLPGAETIPGYKLHLPNTSNSSNNVNDSGYPHPVIHLFRDNNKFIPERDRIFGTEPNVRQFWELMDQLSSVFWPASRKGVIMPMTSLSDVLHNARTVPWEHWHLSRYLTWSVGDVLDHFGLWDNLPLVGLLRCLVEDTVNCNDLRNAPLINSALGITIRWAGLTRPLGGAKGFWKVFADRYTEIGGKIFLGTNVRCVSGDKEQGYLVETNKGTFRCARLVSSLPVETTTKLLSKSPKHSDAVPPVHPLVHQLSKHIKENEGKKGGGIVLFLGVPDSEVAEQEARDISLHGFPFTHHQILQSHSDPLGYGNNMFISVSSPGDTESAPPGHRAVMISTHCLVDPWFQINNAEDYHNEKQKIATKLLAYARRVYPKLGQRAVLMEVGTPRTYAKFTKRPKGMVGGYRLDMRNSNQFAIPQNIGQRWGIWCVGDTTWPGLGTVACVLGSRIASNQILNSFSKRYSHTLASSSPSSLSSVPSFSSSSPSSSSYAACPHHTDSKAATQAANKPKIEQANNSSNSNNTGNKPGKSPLPALVHSWMLAFRHLGDFVQQPEDVHKLLLRYALENTNFHNSNNHDNNKTSNTKYSNSSNNPFVPIAFNPFDVVLLVSDPNTTHDILIGRYSQLFRDRTSFPIIDYTYHRFMNHVSATTATALPAATTATTTTTPTTTPTLATITTPQQQAQELELTGNMGGVTFTNGAVWKRNRSMGVQCMADRKMLTSSIRHFIQCTDEMIDSWQAQRLLSSSSSPSSSLSIDLGNWMSRLGIEIMGHIVFGTSLQALSPSPTSLTHSSPSSSSSSVPLRSSELVRCVRDMLNTLQEYIYVPLPAPLFRYLKTPAIRRLDRSVDMLREWGDQLLQKVKEQQQQALADIGNKNNCNNSNDISPECLTATLQKRYPNLNNVDLQALLMDLLGAGHDTTANLVTFTLAAVTQAPPHVMSRLMTEIQQLGDIFPPTKNNNSNTDEQLSLILSHVETRMPYLNAVVRESLRLYPLGAAFSRVNTVSVRVGEWEIPPDTKLLVAPYVMGRLPGVWGSDVEVFRPERFLDNSSGGNHNTNITDSNIEQARLRDHAYIPLGGGARGCLGGRFGLLEGKVIIARLLQRCHLHSHPTCQPLDSILAFTLRPKHPVLVSASVRQ